MAAQHNAHRFAMGSEREMEEFVSYGNCVIQMQSFELMPGGGWIPRFTLCCPDRSMLSRDRLDKVFPSKDEADEFALGDAVDWLDGDERAVPKDAAPSS